MSEVLNVQPRSAEGKRAARRLRHGGAIPAILYGHGEANICLQAPADEVRAVVRHGTRVVDLKGAVNEKAFIRQLQWDTFGTDVLHLDLARVSADEKVQVKITIELRGEAPGLKQGGIVTHHLHEVEIECPAISIPDKLTLRASALTLGAELLVKDLEVPPGVTILTDADEVVVDCTEPKAELEEAAQAGVGAEPELIGRKAAEEEENA